MAELPEYVLNHVFVAPLNLVWKCWTDPKLLHRWYGPNVETTIHQFDLQVGGVWLNEMKWGGNSDFSKMSFVEVVPLQKIVWHHSSTNADWNVIPSPMMPDWPITLLTTVDFSEKNGSTHVRLSQVPINPTAVEIACFAKVMSRMDKGWGSGYKIMETMLAELQGAKS